MERDYNHNTLNNLNLNAGVCFSTAHARTHAARDVDLAGQTT